MNKRFLRIFTAVIMLVSLFFVTAVVAQAADKDSIITAPPADGTYVFYARSGENKAILPFLGTLYLVYQSGVAVMVEDGNDVYWQDPINGFASGTWIKGTKSGNTITFPYGQPLCYDSGYGDTISARWGTFDPNAVDSKERFTPLTVQKDFVFDIQNDGKKLTMKNPYEGTTFGGNATFKEKFNFMGMFWDDDDDSFSGYGDSGVTLTKLDTRNVTNATPESDKETNNGYIDVYPNAPVGYDIYVGIVPEQGYGIDTLQYQEKGSDSWVDFSRDVFGERYFTMPDEEVTVKATFEAMPPTFVSADKDYSFDDETTFNSYIVGETKWNGYTFAGWSYYDENGNEIKFNGSFDKTIGVTYTAKWKNAAGNYVITDGITVEPDGIYMGYNAFYSGSGLTEKVDSFRIADSTADTERLVSVGTTNESNKSNNFRLNAAERITAGKISTAIRADGKAVTKYDSERLTEGVVEGDSAGVIRTERSKKDQICLSDYGITFTPAHDGQRASLKMKNVSIESGDGTFTYYYVNDDEENECYIYAGLFSEIPLDLKLAGKNTIRIELEYEDSCAFGIFNPSGSMNITGKNLTVDAGSTDCYRSGGIVLESVLENSANVTAIAGDSVDSSYGVNCTGLVNSGGVLKGIAGSGVYSNGINVCTTATQITGGTVIGVGGTGSEEYYGLWTGENIEVSGNGVLALKGGVKKDSTTKEALYLEGENAIITLEDNGKIIADSAVKNAGAYAGRYLIEGAQFSYTIPDIKGSEFIPTDSEYIVIKTKQTNHIHHSGSGDNETTYDVSLSSDIKNGSVEISPKSASEGETVTLKVNPDKGFNLETIKVTDKDGVNLELNKIDKNTFSFTMPDGNVKVSAEFMEDNTMINFCVDVKAGDYFYDAVLWAYKNEICKGVSDTHFGPNYPVTRAQVVTFLWRAAGCPVVNYAMNMKDVPSGEYYSEAVRWALSKGITNGTGAAEFSPEAVCTRGQIVTFLARFAGVKDADTDTVFRDVKSSDYFAAAVKWAKENGVTEGTSQTMFSPADDCTRAQVVTFLYRWMVK